MESMVFEQFTLGWGYKLERFGLEKGIIFQETDQWMTRETGNYHSKIQKHQIGVVWLDHNTSIVSGEQLL